MRSRSANTGAPSTRRSAARTSRRCCIRTTRRRRASSCGSSSNTSSSRARCKTASALLLHGGMGVRDLGEVLAVQLNDTHPTLAIPELMRLLMDIHGRRLGRRVDDHAQGVRVHEPHAATRGARDLAAAAGREALAAPSRDHLRDQSALPRRGSCEVSGRRCAARRMSLIGEAGDKQVRMANLATVASHHINGVAALHSRLLRETVLRDFAELWPERFTNVTNGVTPRRFVALANPGLAELITSAIGDGWQRDLEKLRGLEKLSTRCRLCREVARREAREQDVRSRTASMFDPNAMLDAQCKRIHEYKRQHLNLLHAIALWERIRNGEDLGVPRTFVFAGKAAPAYWMAKLIIRLAAGVGEAIAADPKARDQLRVLFVPDFSVKVAQRIYPAADLSEQISTAGLEASGTGNMKFTLNGALTIGTLDGANVEIREAVGADHFFLFGLDRRASDRRKARRISPRQIHRWRARRCARPDRLGCILARRSRDVRAARARPARARSILGVRRLPRVLGLPAPRRRALASTRAVDRVVDHERRARRSILERPRDRRVCEADLARRSVEAVVRLVTRDTSLTGDCGRQPSDRSYFFASTMTRRLRRSVRSYLSCVSPNAVTCRREASTPALTR